MARYSLYVSHDGDPFRTQFIADSAHDAISKFVDHAIAVSLTPALGIDDFIYLVPMGGLVNMYAASAGRNGRYISLTCVRTVVRQGS